MVQLSNKAAELLKKAVNNDGLCFSREELGVHDASPKDLIAAWGELTAAGYVAANHGEAIDKPLTVTVEGVLARYELMKVQP